jgi:hypothetical protein
MLAAGNILQHPVGVCSEERGGGVQVSGVVRLVRLVCRHGEYMGTCKLTNTVLLDRPATMT